MSRITNLHQVRYEIVQSMLFQANLQLENMLGWGRSFELPATRGFDPGVFLGDIVPALGKYLGGTELGEA